MPYINLTSSLQLINWKINSTTFRRFNGDKMFKRIIVLLILLPTFSFGAGLNSDYMFNLTSKKFNLEKANTVINTLYEQGIVICPSVFSYEDYVDCLKYMKTINSINCSNSDKFLVDNMELHCSVYTLLLKIMFASVSGKIVLNDPDSPVPDFPKNSNKITNWALGTSFILDLDRSVEVTQSAIEKFWEIEKGLRDVKF